MCESDPKMLSSILKQTNDLLKGKNVRPTNLRVKSQGIRPNPQGASRAKSK
jgi:hypothetical protein